MKLDLEGIMVTTLKRGLSWKLGTDRCCGQMSNQASGPKDPGKTYVTLCAKPL